MWATDAAGRVLHDDVVTGSWWRATELTGGPEDTVCVVAVDLSAGGHPEAPEAALIVQCAEFGAIGDGWTSPTETFDPDEFWAAYRPLDDAEKAVVALEHAAASKQATTDDLAAEIERQALWNARVDRRAAQLKKSGGAL